MDGLIWLLLMPLAGVALASVFESSDDAGPDPLPEPEPEPENLIQGSEDDDDLTAPAGFSGLVDGSAGDDRLDLNGLYDPDQPAVMGNDGYSDSDRITYDGPDGHEGAYWREDGGWTFWHPFRSDDIPTPRPDPDALPPGMIAGFGGAGNDTITAEGHSVHVNGGDGDDVLTGHAIRQVLDGGAGDDTITSTTGGIILGGAGDDSIRAFGSGAFINGGEGADSIDIAGLTNSEIWLDGDDQLIGYGQDNTGVVIGLTDVAEFTGHNGDETIIMRGPGQLRALGGNDSILASGGAEVWGGDGNDLIVVSGSGSNSLMGEAGNDTLIGTLNWRSEGSSDRFAHHVGASSDLLDGGDGDDVIRFDNADTVTGGAGADQLVGFLSGDANATVTDFNAADDSLLVYLNPEDAANRFDDVAVTEQDGNTVVSLNGSQILNIQGQTGLAVGFAHGYSFDGMSDDHHMSYTDLAGNAVAREDLDVIIDFYDGI